MSQKDCWWMAFKGFEGALRKSWERYYIYPWQDDSGEIIGLRFGVTRLVHQKLVEKLPSWNSTQHYMETMGFKQFFDFSLDRPWGFDGCFSGIKIDDDWYEYRASFSTNQLSAISRMLELMTLVIHFDDNVVDLENTTQQFLILDGICQTGQMGGCALSFDILYSVTKWLYANTLKLEGEIRSNMRSTHMRIMKRWKPEFRDFRFYWNDEKRFAFSVPGDCACLFVDPQGIRSTQTVMNLSPHNIDSLSQQFTLLIGMATIWQKVREEFPTGSQ